MELRRYLDPRVTWRGTSEVDKVRLYTRQSFVGIVAFLGVVGVAESISRSIWLTAAAMAVCAVAAIVVVLRLPEIGGVHQGDIRWPLVVTFVAGILAGITGSGVLPLWVLLVVAVPVTAVIPLRWSLALSVAVAAATAVSHHGARGGAAAFLAAISMAAGVRLSMWLLAVVTELDSSRQAAAQLSVAEERLRFARDLHDVVGRALSAIAVKSELAATLSRRGDDRAAAQMDEVRELAQQSMNEARQLVRGYRSIDLGAEINGASSLLDAAGIDTEVVGHTGALAPEFAEAAAWIVREGATNILRHSDATYCRIEVTEHSVTIVNDRPHAVTTTDGTGIAGLRERLTAVGGALSTTADTDEFTLTATFGHRVAS